MTGRLEQIQAICDKNKIDYSINDEGRKLLVLKIKRERQSTELFIRDGRPADEFVSDDFYKYRFIQGYEAMRLFGQKRKILLNVKLIAHDLLACGSEF